LKLNDLLGYSFGAMKEQKLRAILTIAMVMIGAGLITALNGLSTGMYQYVGTEFKTLGANVVMVLQKTTPTGQITEQTVSDISQLDSVKTAVPYLQALGTIESGGVKSDWVLITAGDQTHLKEIFPTLVVAQGTLVAPGDLTGIVLGHSVAYPPGQLTPFAQVGSELTISLTYPGETTVTQQGTYTVRGILGEMGTSGMFVPPIDRMVFISLPAGIQLNYTGVSVITTDPEKAEQVADAIRRRYEGSFDVYTSKALTSMIRNITDAYSLFLGSIASVSLIVASVGISAGLYTSVIDRTKEIGLLKAIGLKKRGILGVFLGEATLIGIMGGLLGDTVGVGLGYAMAMLQSEFTSKIWAGRIASYVPPVFAPENFLLVLAFSVAVSMLAGSYPAWRASSLDPVVALRKE
jgi:putative ABC transport system permease protein